MRCHLISVRVGIAAVDDTKLTTDKGRFGLRFTR